MVQEYVENTEEYTKNQDQEARRHPSGNPPKTEKNSGQKSVGRQLFLLVVVLTVGGVGFAHLECGTGYRNASTNKSMKMAKITKSL